jgi:hypothetical protein
MNARPVDEDSLFKGSVSVASDVLMQELPDHESIFLHLPSESYFGLDSVGTAMYRALVNASTVQAAYEDLAARFDVDPERLRQDLRVLVQRLIDQGLLEFHA